MTYNLRLVSDNLLTVSEILFPPCLMIETASVDDILSVKEPLISNNSSPTYNNNIHKTTPSTTYR